MFRICPNCEGRMQVNSKEERNANRDRKHSAEVGRFCSKTRFGPGCVSGQVIKTRRNDQVVKVERRSVIGAGRLEQALRSSEDSAKLNTSFVERLNLTIRQGSAYLGRRTICQARQKQHLEDHIELFRCYYNFIRPHRALKFGREVRTTAMQAELTNRALTSKMAFLVLKNVTLVFEAAPSVGVAARRRRLAA
jgi:hypothetical protein